MMTETSDVNRRILIIDDNSSIHADFRKILAGRGIETSEDLSSAEAALFGKPGVPAPRRQFELASAFQGQEGLEAVRQAKIAGQRFAVAFVDVRMPPGWDGIETTMRLWEVDPDLQIIICTAYSDYSWDEMINRLGHSDRLVILKKPFDAVEVLQLANALTEKWRLLQRANSKLQQLEEAVDRRTRELQASNKQLQSEVQERRFAEQTLGEVREKLSHFLSQSPAVLYSVQLVNGDLVPAWVSENFVAFTGYAVEEWVEQIRGLECVEEADRELARLALGPLVAENLVSHQFRIRRKDGEVRWVQDDRKLLTDGSGVPTEIIGCWTDVTVQRQLEDQLRQAQKMESIGQLAGGVAHDFNNLLTVIFGYVEMLLRNCALTSDMMDPLRQIHRAADRAGNLTRQLLAFSRKQTMRVEELSLGELIGGVAQMLGRTLGEHIAVETHLSNDIPAVLADRGMLEQVIMNLAVNARDAMPEGGRLSIDVSVRDIDEDYLRLHPDAEQGRFACVTMKDSGCGIPKDHLPRLFEPFFTTKEVGKGTGLGLATAYGIVKQHDGWIEVESEIDQGTTFRIFLPVSGKTIPAVGPLAATTSLQEGRERVLVVEDEEALRDLISRTLKRHGYDVQVAATGAEALKHWGERLDDIDLLLTDVVMPEGLSGWDLAKQFQHRKPSLRVLFMSGYNAEMTLRKPVSDAEVNLLQKPFGLQRLTEALRECLDHED